MLSHEYLRFDSQHRHPWTRHTAGRGRLCCVVNVWLPLCVSINLASVSSVSHSLVHSREIAVRSSSSSSLHLCWRGFDDRSCHRRLHNANSNRRAEQLHHLHHACPMPPRVCTVQSPQQSTAQHSTAERRERFPVGFRVLRLMSRACLGKVARFSHHNMAYKNLADDITAFFCSALYQHILMS